MTNLRQIYKCEICGNVTEVLHEGQGELVCCGQPMNLQKENMVDASYEKHIPLIERDNEGIKVKCGAEPHPMTDDHYIEWIEIEIAGEGKVCRKKLNPGEAPEVHFRANVPESKARAYCNLHGLWKSK